MAIPALTNASIPNVPGALPTNLPALTAYLSSAPGPSGAGKTCNLTSDTILYRADGAIWDDTQGCFISVDITSRRPTPRLQDDAY